MQSLHDGGRNACTRTAQCWVYPTNAKHNIVPKLNSLKPYIGDLDVLFGLWIVLGWLDLSSKEPYRSPKSLRKTKEDFKCRKDPERSKEECCATFNWSVLRTTDDHLRPTSAGRQKIDLELNALQRVDCVKSRYLFWINELFLTPCIANTDWFKILSFFMQFKSTPDRNKVSHGTLINQPF